MSRPLSVAVAGLGTVGGGVLQLLRDNADIVTAREKQKRNFLATLFLSQGVPMIVGGDEIGRTQNGNNNAYCQDNEISWTHWDLDERKIALRDFVTKMIELRKAHPNLRRRKFYQDRVVHNSLLKDIAWYGTDGKEMDEGAWNDGWAKSLASMFNGQTLNVVNEMGQPVTDDTFLVLLNSAENTVVYTLPESVHQKGWHLVLDTSNLQDPFKWATLNGSFDVHGRSLVLMKEATKEGSE